MTAEIDVLTAQLEALVAQAAQTWSPSRASGLDIAATLLATAGDNPDRLRHASAVRQGNLLPPRSERHSTRRMAKP